MCTTQDMSDDRIKPSGGQSLMRDASGFIADLVAKNGPDPMDYEPLSAWHRQVMMAYYLGAISWDEITMLWSAFGEAYTPKTMQGFVARRPHGYHGDFEVIDRIYTQWVSPDPSLRKWDEWFHSLQAPRVVRNRKMYFHRLMEETQRGHVASMPLAVLNVGSGPARDVMEYMSSGSADGTTITCMDMDPNAVEYGQALCHRHLARIEFFNGNFLLRLPPRQYHLVWCAGVFDYLNDRLFQVALRRLLRCVAPGGQLVVGNFSPANTTRAIMEFGGWKLIHRSEDDLANLAITAGIPKGRIAMGRETEGVNLFLHIRHE